MSTNFQLIHNEVFISKSHLINLGMNQGTLNNLLCNNNYNTFRNFKDSISKTTWILFKSIPLNYKKKFNLPDNEHEAIEYIILKSKEYKKEKDNTKYTLLKYCIAESFYNRQYWLKYLPYYKDYLFDEKKRNNFAKTHSVLNEIIKLKDSGEKMKVLFDMFNQLESSVFKTDNIRSFYNKIKKARETSIEEALVHEFRRFGRGPYKLKAYIKKAIKKYYSNPLRYSTREITYLVNQELISRKKPTVSYSTVQKFINQPEVKNQCQILRLGKKYAEQNLLPYVHRIKPEFSGQVLEIDSTRINIPFLDDYNEISYLNLCAAIDVHSNKIVGFSFALNEDGVMILECLKKSFIKMKLIPTQIIIDNHKGYTSRIYQEFKYKSELYGISHRHSKVGNPKDKGHIERWFYTFQTKYLNSVFGSLGNGIKSKIQGRTNAELEKFYMKKENLRKRKELELELAYLINKYNDNFNIKGNKKSPNEVFQRGIIDHAREFTIDDIARLFFEKKIYKVKRSTIIMEIKGERYIYIVYNEILANKINGTNIIVMYAPLDLNKVYLFDNITQEYYGAVDQFIPVSIIPNSKEKKSILRHQKKVKEMIFRNTKSLVKEIEQGEEELEAIPLKTIKEVNDQYEIKRKELEKMVFEFTINSITKEKKFYNSFKNKKSMSGIMPVKSGKKRNKNNKIQVIDK